MSTPLDLTPAPPHPSPAADHWRLLVDALPDAVLMLDPGGRVTGWNGTAVRVLGFTADEMIGRSFARLYPPEDAAADRPAADLRGALAHGRCETEGRWGRKDGPPLRATATVTALRDHARHVGFAVVIRAAGKTAEEDERAARLRQAEADARQATDLLRAVADGTPDAVFVKDRAGKYLLFNETASRFVGRPVADVLGRDDTALFDPAGARLVMDRDRRVRESGEAETEEEELTAAGVTRTYLATKAPYRDATGTVIGVIGVSRDITERKRAEAALRASEERFRRMADAAPVLIWVAGVDKLCNWFNRPWLEFTGRTLEQEIGDGWADNVHPDDFRRCLDTYLTAFDARAPFTMEYRLRRHDGAYRWVLDSGTPLYGAGAEFAGYIGSCVDITDRRLAEEALRAERDRFARIAAVSPGAIHEFRVRPDGTAHFPYASPGIAEIYGLRPEDLAADAGVIYTLIHPDDLGRVNATIAASTRDMSPWRCEYRVRHPVKGEIWVEGRSSPAREPDGGVLWYGILMDVTDRKRVEEAVRTSERSLARAQQIAHLGDWEQDLITGVLRWSAEVFRIFGTESAGATLTADDFFRAVHPDDLEAVRAAAVEAIRGRRPYQIDHRIVWADGTVRHVHEHAEILFDEADRAVSMVGTVQDVTDRKRAEDALEHERALLQSFIDALPDIAFTKDTAGRFVVSNRAHQEWAGTGTGVDLVGKTVFDLYPPHLARAYHEDDLRVIRHGETVLNREELSRDTTGREQWYLTIKAPLRDRAGGITGLVGISRNIQDRKEAEETLRTSEERFRSLVEAVKDYAIFMLAPDGVVVTWNAGASQITGYPAKETEGQHVARFYTPDDVTAGLPAAHLARAAADGRHETEGWRVRKDGTRFWAGVVATALRDGAGRLRGFTMVVQDLTDRRRSGELLRAMSHSVTDAIVTIDERGAVQSANPAAERIFGYAAADLIGQNVNVLMPDPYRAGHDRYIADYLRTGVAKIIGTGREVSGRRKDGSAFPAELAVTEFRLDGTRHFVGVVRDVSERKRLEDQVRQAQKMEAVGRLAGGVAHDFNNLLTVINGYSDLLLGVTPAADPARGPVAAIRDAGERAAGLTAQLLAFSRRAIIEPKLLDLNGVLAQIARLIGRLIGEDIALVTALAPGLGRVNVDPGQLEQVIMNLAVNARDAMPTGGRLTVETRAVEVLPEDHPTYPDVAPGHYVQLAVSDTGCGMTDEVKARIFEPFFTTKEVGKGTGLGLATVYGIVKTYGGQVSVYSEVGVGSTFKILLPEAPGDAGGPSSSGVITAAPRGAETILLVEDEPAVRKIAKLALETQGYRVLEAGGGAEAVRTAGQHPGPIHLLVTDVVMPGMGGRAAADALRQKFPGLRVLYVSGYTDDAVVRHGVIEETDAFLQKPFTPLGLARKVRSVLDGAG